MAAVRWLEESEQRAWRGLMAMNKRLEEFVERQLRSRDGLSDADFQVLAHLSEAPRASCAPSSSPTCCAGRRAACLSTWGRMQTRGGGPQHVADVRSGIIDQLTAEELATLSAGALAPETRRAGARWVRSSRPSRTDAHR